MAPFSILKLMYGPIFENSDTRESESRGIREKTGKFTEIKHSRLGHSRNLWKKRGIPRSLDTRDSESRGICEKTGKFMEFRHSRFRKSRIFWAKGYIFTFLKLMDGPFLLWSLWMPLSRYGAVHKLIEAYGWPLFVYFTQIFLKAFSRFWSLWMAPFCIFHPYFLKKRGSDTGDSESREICEKTRDFTEFRHSRFRESRDLWKNLGFHGIQSLEIPKFKDFVEQRGISRNSESRDSKNPWLQTLEIPKVKDFHVFEAYGWPLLSLKLMDAPFALWGYP